MSNTATAKAEYVRRFMNLQTEIDTLKEDQGELMKEVKSKADELGFEPKDLRAAVALLRKGPNRTAKAFRSALDFLVECGDADAKSAMEGWD